MSAVSAAAMLMSPVNGGPVIPSSLNTGMVGYWKLDGNSLDSIGSSNGTDTGVTYTTGKVNQGATFGGSGNIDFGTASAIKPRTGMSVAGWFKWTSFSANVRALSDWHQGGTIVDRWILGYEADSAGDVRFVISTFPDGLSAATVLTGFGGLNTGTWYHLCGTYDQGTGDIKTYRNGLLITTTPTTVTSSPTMVLGAGSIRLGTQAEAGGTFNGVADEIYMHNRALTALEVQGLVDAGNYGIQAPF